MPRTFGLVPAAGKSVRMGQPKLLLPWRGNSIIYHVVSALREGGVEAVLVVVRPGDAALRTAAEEVDAKVLELSQETPDMKATLLAGLAEIGLRWNPAAADGFLLVPADHPTLDPSLVAAMLRESADASILVPTFAGKRGHPTWVAWKHVPAIQASPPNEGLNAYLRRHAEEVCEMPWNSDQILRDLDTPEDYARLRSN